MTQELQEDNCYVALTQDHLDSTSMIDRVRSPQAGAIVLFAGKVSNTGQGCDSDFSKVQLVIISLENQ
jgi:molybdopterin synthase catalytic subunit